MSVPRRKTIMSACATAGAATQQSRTAHTNRTPPKLAGPARGRENDELHDRRQRDRGGVDGEVVVGRIARVGAVEVADVGLAGAVGLAQVALDRGAVLVVVGEP